MEKLFSYGTLQIENVQISTFGRKLNGEKDTLNGYIRSTVKIKNKTVIKTSGSDCHPILQLTGINSDTVHGTIFEITTKELLQADEYEVEEYKRIQTTFKSGQKAWVYVAANK